MNKQTVVIMAILAGSISVASGATAATVTPPPAIAKAMASVTHRYCQMDANSQGKMQRQLFILGIKTPIRTGIDWPLVLNFKETCAPTKADLHLYKEANRPFVVAVRNLYHAPVWNTREAFDFCAKQEGVKGWSSVTSFGQYTQVFFGCFPHKK